MEESRTNSTTPFNDTSTNINEMLPEQNNIVSSSSPTNKIKRNKIAIVKPANQSNGFLLKSHPSTDQADTPQDDAHKSYKNHPGSEKNTIPSFFSKFKKQRPVMQKNVSVADNTLKDIIYDLDANTTEEQAFEEKETPPTGSAKCVRKSRKIFGHVLENPKFHYLVIVLIMIDLIIVFIELVLAQLSVACFTDEEMKQYNTTEQRDNCLLPPTEQLENGETALYYISLVLISFFVIEIFSAFYAFGWRHFTKILYLVDAIIVLVSFVLEVYFHYGGVGKAGRAAGGIVVLRMWKIIRAIHAVAHAVSLKNRMIIEEIKKAREIVNEEKLQAEETIHEQQNQINYLTDLLDKSGKQSLLEQDSGPVRNRAKSLDTITFF